ncbi:hemagglutinin repeat-containing protein [Acinetobacter sp. CE-15]|uniref:hemagglutinin repeat-containing protein n=1 Tax=Acinetobacter sp. CE-15 TaxID=3425693 RepID=UPI003DA5F00A
MNNAQGQINSKNLLQLNSQGQLLDNSQGTLSSESIKIDSGRLNNNQGLIQAQHNIQIDTHNQDLVNTNSGQQGGILSQGDIQLSNVKTLNNSQGYLASAKELGIQVNQVLNQQGTILAGKQLNIWGTGQNQLLDNQSGQLLSMGGMTLNIDRINNNGKLKPSDADSHIMAVGDLNITTQQLDNQNTLTISPTDTSIQGIDANNLNITTNILNNQTGAIRSSGNQNLNIRQILNNQSGQISSEKQLIIVGDQLEINNLKGQILSGTGLNLTAKSLSGNGKVLSLGDAQVNLKESYTHGVGAQLQANQNLSLITQGNIINYGTINSGNRLDINAVNIGNMVDAKIESHETRLTAQNELNNTGLINGDYTRLQANTLNNQGTGRIYGTTLAINANTLNNQPNSAGVAPVIASRGDMYLGVQVLNNLANTADYASQSLIFSAGNLYLGGGLDANDKTVGQALVINNESATIESLGNMRLSAKQINNINKNFKTQLVEIERKDNLEKFYQGDWKTFDGVLIARKDKKEDWAKYTYSQVTSETRVIESAPGQIKAGSALNLDGAQVLNDKSQILAGGVLSNLGGSITSGDLEDTKGIRKVVATGTQRLSEIVYNSWGKKKRKTKNKSFTNTQTETFDLAVSQALGNQKFNQNKIVTTLVSNNQSGDNTQSSQTQQTNLNGLKDTNNSTQVKQTQNSQGENLTVKEAGNVLNSIQSQTGQKNQPLLQSKDLDLNVSGSQVTVSKVEQANAQNLTTGQASDLTNSIQTQKGQGAQASLQSKDLDVSASGANINVSQAEQANGKNLTTGHTADLSNTTQTQTGQFNQPSQQSKDLNANLLDENVSLSKAGQVNDQNQQLTDTKQVDNSSQVNGLQQNSSSLQSKDLNISVGQTSQKQGDTAGQAQANNFTQQANAPSETDESTQYEIRTLNSSELKVPNSALYRVNANSKAGYLVETDPSFTNYKTWLSSDYMLDALGLDPALQQKRLADGLYEQRLVQDQIANLTGYRFLEGYANDDEQYKALMNNGVSFAKLYGLRPGIALTAAQTAQLTSDIVWLVEQTVILPNGTKAQALVPQVYVKARVGDLKGDGTLLSGDAIQFKLDGDLINGATIAGRQAVQITADNVQNLNGRIHGNQVAIETKKDLNNIGGQISAKESMALKVGGNLNIESTTLSTESKIGGFSSSQTSIDRVAGIYVGSGSQKKLDPSQTTLLIDVAGNTNLKAAQINNSNGTTILNTLGNLDIGTVTTSQTEQLKIDSKNGYQYKKQQDIGSQINSEGSLVLNGQNINIQGSALNSEQGITQVTAKDFIHIEEGRKISDMESQWFNKSRGLLGSKQQSSYIHDKSDEALVSTITGKSVILNANNIDIRGSQIVSNDLTQIQAKNNINIIAAENYYLNESQEIKKKSGFTASLSGGVASVGYGKSSLKTEQKNQSTALVQSQIISTQGNTNILAGKDLTSEAAILGAGKDLNLQGVNVNLNAGYESNTLHSLIQSKNSGVSVGLTYSPMAAVVSTYKKNAGSDQFSDSAVGQLMSRAEALNKAAQAAITPVVVTAGSHKSSQTSDYNNTQAVVTQAIAKGNLNIIATDGSINSQGAQLAAEGNALLHAKDSINLDYVTDHEAQTANSKQSGFSIDNRDKSAPAGVYNNKDKGQGNVDKVTGTQLSVGGKTTLQTEKGDINILGSSVASQGDVKINAANDVNIKSAQSSQSQSQSSSNKGIGSAQISDTEQFYGYMKGKNQSNSQSIEQQRSQVGSLEGNVNIQAGNNYNQQVADIVANKDINITAKQISVLDDYNTGSSDSSSKDLKVGVFKRISSPILDLLGSADKATKGNAADDRTQALQGLAAGAQAYQSYSDIKGGSVAKAEAGIGFSTSKNQQSNSYVTSQQNQISAGGNVNLTSTAGDIHLQNTQVKAKETISLDSAKNILLESGQSQEKAQGKNSNAGLSVGVGASVGAQTGAYIYAEAGYGKGSNQLDRNTHTQTTLEANKVSLTSKGDTTLAGAKATANRIDADVGGKLSIISQQDQVEQKIDQSGAGARVQASLGTAWQASGNLSNSSANASSNSVNQQAGLFAGDGGYHVKADQVDLKGGAIVSTSKKENNDLTANRLTFSDINNKSSYDATSVSLSGGTSFNKDKPTGDGKASNPTNNENWRNATSFSPSLPQHESDKDSSVTRSTLSEGNITIGGQATTTTALGIHSDASTAHRSVDTLPNLQEILDKQKTVADATSTIAAASRTYSQNQQKQAEAEKKNTEQTAIAELQTKGGEDWNKYQNSDNEAQKQELLKNNSPSYKQASETAQDWGMGGDKSRAVNAVAMAVTGALGGQTDLQVAANALAPYAANIIGKELGHGEDKNKAAQLAAHAILGAALAYVNGGNPAAGGSAAVASEAAADYLTNQYKDKKEYQDVNGEFQPNLLPEDVKTQIRDLTAAIGAVVGGTVGDSSFNAQLSGVVGQNAVENNALITESPDGKSRHYTPEDNKFNLLQYLVATGQLTLDQVPDSIFEDMANRGYTSLTDGDKAPNNSSEEEKYRQNFIEGIKDEQIISEQKFLELMNKNPEMWAEVKEAIETKQFWEGVKEPVFKYVLPGLQLGGGVVQTIGAGAIDVVGCATIVACGVAVGGSSLLIINGLDDIRTGWNNFGGLPEGQTVSSTLTSLGVSEGTAGWVKLGVGGASIGAEAIAINQGLKATTNTFDNVTNTSNQPVISEKVLPGKTKELISGSDKALLNGEVVYPQIYKELYHGADAKSLNLPDNLSSEQLASYIQKNGLNARGTNIELMSHQAGNRDTAFRGTTTSVISQGGDAGAAYWAGPNGIVVELKNVKGYDLDALQSTSSKGIGISGMVQKNTLGGELEISVPAQIDPSQINRIGIVKTTPNGKTYVDFDWGE